MALALKGEYCKKFHEVDIVCNYRMSFRGKSESIESSIQQPGF